jgi:hypothetical protein
LFSFFLNFYKSIERKKSFLLQLPWILYSIYLTIMIKKS